MSCCHLHQHASDCDDGQTVTLGELRRRIGEPTDRDGRYLPPSQPPGWVDPDPLDVEPEPVAPRRRAYQGWELDREPISIPWAFVIVAFCAGVLAGALILTVAKSVDAAPFEDRSSGNLSQPTGVPPAAASLAVTGGGAPAPLAVTPVPSPSGEIGSALIGGWATYYPACSECAAAGPLLQAALGPHWKGQTITVVSDFGQVDLRLVTSCACGDRRGQPTIIDVSIPAFNELSPIAAGADTDPGLVAVSIEIPGARPTLPPTDTPRHPDDLRMMLEVRGDEVYR